MKTNLTTIVLLVVTSLPTLAAEEIDGKKMERQDAVAIAIEGKTVKGVNVGGHTFHIHDVSVYMRRGRIEASGILRHSRAGHNAQVNYKITFREGT